MAGWTPLLCKKRTTLTARAVESAQLSGNEDLEPIFMSSVYPATTTFLPLRSLKASATASSAAFPSLLSAADPEPKRILSFSFTVILPLSSEISTWPLAICCSSEPASCAYCALFASSAPFSCASFAEAAVASATCCCKPEFCCCKAEFCCCTSPSFFSSAADFSASCWYFCKFCCVSRCCAANSSIDTPHARPADTQIARVILFIASSRSTEGIMYSGRAHPEHCALVQSRCDRAATFTAPLAHHAEDLDRTGPVASGRVDP